MTSGERIIRSLRGQKELENQLAFGFARQKPGRPYLLDCEEGGVRLRLEVEDFDRLGVLLTDMQFELQGLDSDGDRFDGHIEALSRGTRHLGIGLRLIERDDNAMQAVLRTIPTREAASRYFEMILLGDLSVTLRHFTLHKKTRQRTPTSANMSMEAFVQLVDGLFGVFNRSS